MRPGTGMDVPGMVRVPLTDRTGCPARGFRQPILPAGIPDWFR